MQTDSAESRATLVRATVDMNQQPSKGNHPYGETAEYSSNNENKPAMAAGSSIKESHKYSAVKQPYTKGRTEVSKHLLLASLGQVCHMGGQGLERHKNALVGVAPVLFLGVGAGYHV